MGVISKEQQEKRILEIIGGGVIQKYLLLLEIGFAHSKAITKIVLQDISSSPIYEEYKDLIESELLSNLYVEDVESEKSSAPESYDEISEQFDKIKNNVCNLIKWDIIFKLNYLDLDTIKPDNIENICEEIYDKGLKDFDKLELD